MKIVGGDGKVGGVESKLGGCDLLETMPHNSIIKPQGCDLKKNVGKLFPWWLHKSSSHVFP